MLFSVTVTAKNGYTECVLGSPKKFFSKSRTVEPFYCLHCTNRRQEKEIAALNSKIGLLLSKLTELESSTSPSNSPAPEASNQLSYAQAALPGPSVSPTQPGSSTAPQIRSPDRKFNIDIYGIAECEKGSRKHIRLSKDTQFVSEVLSSLDPEVTTHSVQDCIRLGKYLDSKNRPILVKLSRACDVSSILSNRYKLASSPRPSIKADMSPEERAIYSALLTQRWMLITNGVSRANIRIRGKSLYVHNKNMVQLLILCM